METKCNDEQDYKYFLFPPMKEGHGDKIDFEPEEELLIEKARCAGKEIIQLNRDQMSKII
jgi:hypothetical protein